MLPGGLVGAGTLAHEDAMASLRSAVDDLPGEDVDGAMKTILKAAVAEFCAGACAFAVFVRARARAFAFDL